MNKNHTYPNFPVSRLRRLRKTPALRGMFRETHLSKEDFIYPLFIVEGANVKKEISSMPGQFQMSVDNVLRECEELQTLGINSILLFGIPESKDAVGSGAYDANGIIQKTLRAVKKEFPELLAITDVCLCEYTSHGHCGVIENERVQNDETLELLAKEALSHAENGADIIAPSDMMDGRVAAIRKILDEKGFAETPIMAYSAKFSSAFLRTVSGSSRIRAAVRRPQIIPDGFRKFRRSVAGNRPRYSGRRGHRDGQARAFLFRLDSPRAR